MTPWQSDPHNSATESVTYLLAAPSLAWAIMQSLDRPRPDVSTILLRIALILAYLSNLSIRVTNWIRTRD